ncbi:hypothetical protein PENNAL_c0012G06420 [Penicillium nalgiovense]|uniref:Uncharacterized protein n=1 Tax=Penicillium nalgiovense TaxID=60175 RepID=A0A1V6YT61_PENNA|nr:hypothetical protein PENNAL_c0012G06420 [Penicillium nalgiovense]
MSLVIPGKRLGYQATSTKRLDIVAQEQSQWVTGDEAQMLNVEEGEADSCLERRAVIVTVTVPGEVGQRSWQSIGSTNIF